MLVDEHDYETGETSTVTAPFTVDSNTMFFFWHRVNVTLSRQ